MDRGYGIGKALFLLGGAAIFGAIAYLSAFGWPILHGTVKIIALVFSTLFILYLLNRISYCLNSPVRRWIHWIYASTIEVFVCLVIFSLSRFKSLSYLSRRMGSSTGRPILLIHGYLHDHSAWIYQRARLASAGFGPIYSLTLQNPFLSIRSYVKQIAQKAEEIEKETGRRDLVLIGHSMGGLVACLYALSAPRGTVKDVITIGSPLAGTAVARIGIGVNAKEMRRNSELIEEIQRELAKEHPIHFYHIATRTDLIVIPYHSALIGNHPERLYTVDDVGHASLLFSSRVADQICKWLKNPSQNR